MDQKESIRELITAEERQLLDHLSQFVSDHKKETIEKVLDMRTRKITVVLEDVYQSQNASAVVRTCECLGLQDVHIIENKSEYQINKYVLRGAQKWMNITKHNQATENIQPCFQHLRSMGYTIFATDPGIHAMSINDVDVVNNKVALVFGNELRGVSKEVMGRVDGTVKIPMYGFTESFNLSVSVAICVNTLVNKLKSSGKEFGLSPIERDVLRLAWFRKIVRNSYMLEREFMNSIR